MNVQARVTTLLVAGLLAAVPATGVAEPTAHPRPGPAPEAASTASDTASPNTASPGWATLITGDRVAYRQGRDAVEVMGVRPAPGSSGLLRSVDLGDRVRVVPAEAQRHVDAGTIDPDLFDLTVLAGLDATPSVTIRTSDGVRRVEIPTARAEARALWRSLVRDDRVRRVELDGAPSVESAAAARSDSAAATQPCTRSDNPTQPGPDKAPVTITGLDRNGESVGGRFLLHAYHCRPWERYGYIEFGAGANGRTFYLPAGSYSLLGDITTRDRSGRFPNEVTIGGDLQIDIAPGDTAPRQIVVDARDAVPLDAETPRLSETGLAVVGWTRGADDHRLATSLILSPQYSPITRLSVIPADPIRDGEFDFYPTLRQSAPLVRAKADGVPALRPKLLPGGLRADFDRRLRLVESDAACDGCAVLVRERLSTGFAGQVREAIEAGAAAVIVMPWRSGTVYGSAGDGTVPVLAVPYAEGQALLDRLRSGRTSVRVQVAPHPPYLYDLAMHESDVLPDDLTYEFKANDLRRIEQRFHSDGGGGLLLETRYPLEPCRCSLTPVFSQIATGTSRVDYVSDNGSVWQHQLFRPGLTLRDEGQPYDAATPDVVDWLSGPLVPGLTRGLPVDHYRFPALRQADSLVFRVPQMTDGAGHGGSLGTATGQLRRDGEVVTELTYGGYATVPAGDRPANWRLELEHEHPSTQWATATSGSMAWTFTAGGPAPSEPAALPLIDARIDLPLTLSGGPEKGSPRVTVRPWRLDGGSPRIERIQLELSTDDGATWTEVVMRGDARAYRAALPRTLDGPVSLRLQIADRDGSTLVRTIHDAWRA